jgi:hypothetical protein
MLVKIISVVAFLAGLGLAVRVMFFGVERRVDEHHLKHRAWPLALAAFLIVAGTLLYVRAGDDGSPVTPQWLAVVVGVGVVSAAGARWLVKRSAAAPSTDPDDDPRFRFQGHVARVIQDIVARPDGETAGRIAFDFDGKRHELQARWTGAEWAVGSYGRVQSEVVIERVEGDVAYVEPWTVVEERL